jgi:hypothetical protein
MLGDDEGADLSTIITRGRLQNAIVDALHNGG